MINEIELYNNMKKQGSFCKNITLDFRLIKFLIIRINAFNIKNINHCCDYC